MPLPKRRRMPETDAEPLPDVSCPAGRLCCGFRCADPLAAAALPAGFLLCGWPDEAEDFAAAGLAGAGLAAPAGFVPAAGFVPVAGLAFAAGFAPEAGAAPAAAGLAAAGLAAVDFAVAGLAGVGRFAASAADLGADGLRTTLLLLPETSPAELAGLGDTPVDDVVPAVSVAGVAG